MCPLLLLKFTSPVCQDSEEDHFMYPVKLNVVCLNVIQSNILKC